MTEGIVAAWRAYVRDILNKLGLTAESAAQYTEASASTIRNWTNPDNVSRPDLWMVADFAISLSQPLRPALAAAGLPPDQLGLDNHPPHKTPEQLVVELHDIANELAQMAADPQNPSASKRKGVSRILLGINPAFSARGDRPPL